MTYPKIWIFVFLLSSFFATAQNRIAGTVLDETNSPVIGASVIISGTQNGTVTDASGKFELRTKQAFPVTIEVSFIGYRTAKKTIEKSSNITIKLEPDENVLDEVSIVERRLSEKQQNSALTVEAMDVMAIKETPSVSFYDGLSNLKGVDLTSASIGFKIVNTRGFNSTSPVRSLQIIDGVDNQAPGLNFALGNFLGASELDVMNVDVIAGASTAFYGPNAFNGVISMTTKDPFVFKGLSASIKGGERNLGEVAVRWADVIKNKKGEDKFAYKINFFYLTANDWEATNLSAVDESNLTDDPTPSNNPGGYDAVNRYGDEQPFDDGGDVKTYPGLGTYHRPGIEEQYIVDYDTRNLKFNTSLHYRFRPDLELIYAFNYGTGTTVYQGDNRFSLKGIKFMQNRVELQKKGKWFIRAYQTQEDAGESYDAYFTALRMQDSAISDQLFSIQYPTLWQVFYADSVRALPGYPSESLPGDEFRAAMDELIAQYPNEFERWHRQNQRRVTDFNGRGASVTPGTQAFEALKNDIISKYANEGGSRLYDKSALYHLQGEYKFDPIKPGIFTIGFSGRIYTPDSRGTIFSDTNGVEITNHEFGIYGGWEREFFTNRLKASATFRVDKNQNFDALFSPAISLVYKLDEINTLRFSFSSAIRNPTLQDQYLYYNTGPAILIGNLNGFDSLVTLDNIQDYLKKSGPDRLSHDFGYSSLDAIKPEQVRTTEVGYRTTLWKRIYLDANYYFSWYNNFIGYVIAAQIEEGNTAIDRLKEVEVYRIAANAQQRVTTQGFSLGLNYYFADYYSLSGNYTWNILNTETDDPIVPAFNTPENKFNVGLGGRNMPFKWGEENTWGFQVTYKWIQGFRFEGSPQFTGDIDSYALLDAQLNLAVKKWKTTFKVGASNGLNNHVYQVYGGPQVGRLIYLSALYDWMKD